MSQRVLSTYLVESRVPLVGIAILVWVGISHKGSIPHIGTLTKDPLEGTP